VCGAHGSHLNLASLDHEPGLCGHPQRARALIPDLRRLDPFGFTLRGYRPGSLRQVAIAPHMAAPGAAAGRVKPIDQGAYRALEAIHRGRWADLVGVETWIKAFTMAGWLVEGEHGPVLTNAGLKGRRDLMRRKSQGSRLRMHDDQAARGRRGAD
jgi:hypothetical protein